MSRRWIILWLLPSLGEIPNILMNDAFDVDEMKQTTAATLEWTGRKQQQLRVFDRYFG